jgi:hypothetical protein
MTNNDQPKLSPNSALSVIGAPKLLNTKTIIEHSYSRFVSYLQSIKARQVVECACLDWCNLIVIQVTTTYTIRTK